MNKKELRTANAPQAAGPYSQGIQIPAASLCFTAGQIGKNPQTGELLPDVEGQTCQALENIRAILTEAGTDLSGVVKTTVHLQNFDDFDRFNEVYAEFFAKYAPDAPLPARTTVQSELGGVLVEIDAIAVK